MRAFRGWIIGLAAAAASVPRAAVADVAWNGFLEAAYGFRVSSIEVDPPRDFTLEEARAQLRMSAFSPQGEAFLRADYVHDEVVSPQSEMSLREGFLKFRSLADHLEVKAGRQIMTWGTGDLLFINDLFPKDWESFFIGREDQYLKAPADALRLGIFVLPMDLDLVWTPLFTPDLMPTSGRLPVAGRPASTAGGLRLARDVDKGEVAIRLARYIASYALSFYGYRGFYKAPEGSDNDGLFHPELSAYGASLRGGALGGVGWIEAGYYDSRRDRDGDRPGIPNSTWRVLAGLERQLAADFNAGVQYYGEFMTDHGAYLASRPPSSPEKDELRHLLTLRLEKMLHYQTVRLSGFGFFSPSDEDLHVRAHASYRLSDSVEAAAGFHLFYGERGYTQFGSLDAGDNLYVRLRYNF